MNSIETSTTFIRIVGLSKYYGDFCALEDATIDVAPGEFLTLLGPSGSGKSTLLMSMAGFIDPSRGDIVVAGQSVIDSPPEKRDFGVVFQGYALFPHMTVAGNLAYPLIVRKMDRAEIQKRVRETLELVQLSHLAERYPKQLSGGQQQRVALARALVFSPKIMLLDEPMGALDKKLRRDLQVELRYLHRQTGRTFINVTHDQEEAMAMSDRIAVMNRGRIVQVGKPRALYERPRTRFVADFLGKSNFIEGTVAATSGAVATIETADGIIQHQTMGEVLPTGASILLALRPEKLVLGQGLNKLPVRVETAVFLGTHAEVTVRTASGLLLTSNLSVEHAAELPAEGTAIDAAWESSSTVAVEAD